MNRDGPVAHRIDVLRRELSEKLEQAEAEAASLRLQLSEMRQASNAENDYQVARAEKAEIAAEALRQSQARLMKALREIERMTDQMAPFQDAMAWAVDLSRVATQALASVDPLPQQEGQ